MSTIYLNERINVILIPRVGIGKWLCKPATVETIEMNTLLVNGTFYERDTEICGLLRLKELSDQEEELEVLREAIEYQKSMKREVSPCELSF